MYKRWQYKPTVFLQQGNLRRRLLTISQQGRQEAVRLFQRKSGCNGRIILLSGSEAIQHLNFQELPGRIFQIIANGRKCFIINGSYTALKLLNQSSAIAFLSSPVVRKAGRMTATNCISCIMAPWHHLVERNGYNRSLPRLHRTVPIRPVFP